MRTRILAAAIIALPATLVAADMGDATTAMKTAAIQCRALDHRASAGSNDDNTIEGMKRDVARGGSWSELDAVPVLGGTMLFHETRWEQGTNGTGLVKDSTHAYASTLRTSTYDQQVPTLKEAVTYLDRSGGHALIELHHWPTWTPAHLSGLVTKIKSRGLQGHVFLTGTKGALAALAEVAPGLIAIYRVDRDEVFTRGEAHDLSVEGVQVGLQFDAARVAAWRRAGFRVWARQTKPDHWGAWISRNVLTVQSDHPGDWLRLCRSRV